MEQAGESKSMETKGNTTAAVNVNLEQQHHLVVTLEVHIQHFCA